MVNSSWFKICLGEKKAIIVTGTWFKKWLGDNIVMGCFLVSEFRDSIPTSLYFTEGLQISFHLGPIFFHLGNNWKPFLLLGKYAKSYVLHAISHLCLLNYLSLLLWVADCELSVELLSRCLMNCQTISKLWLVSKREFWDFVIIWKFPI